MIKLDRETKIPVSLTTPAVQTFLSDLQDFKDGILDAKPNPPSNYRNWDVLEAFDKCFFSKCYLTEQKYINSWSMDIEHFIPKSENPSLVYDWENLFPANHDANMMKRGNTPSGGYLHPCQDNPEIELIQILKIGGVGADFIASNNQNIKAKNTANLLNYIHNGNENDENTIKKTAELRGLIYEKHEKVRDLITDWLDAKSKNDKIREMQNKEQIKKLLSRKESFTMLIRSSPYVKKYVPIEFLD